MLGWVALPCFFLCMGGGGGGVHMFVDMCVYMCVHICVCVPDGFFFT